MPPASGTADSSAEASAGSYTVSEGDTLTEIGRANGVSYEELARWNEIGNPNLIYPGQSLRLTAP